MPTIDPYGSPQPMPTGTQPMMQGGPGYGPEGSTPPAAGGGGGGGDVIGALIGLGTSIMNNYQARKMAQQQNAWNKENALEAYNRDLEQWSRQNEYNSPQAQMDRYKAAGLNPNLIYGGTNSGGNASGSPSARVPSSAVGVPGLLANVPNILGMYQDFSLKQAQIDNVKAATDNTQQRTINESIREGALEIEKGRSAVKLNVEKDYSYETGMYRAKQVEQDVANQAQKWSLLNQQEQINLLRMDQMRRNLTATDLDNEKRQADIMFKQNENQWRAAGVTSSDHVIMRMLVRLFHTDAVQQQVKPKLKY